MASTHPPPYGQPYQQQSNPNLLNAPNGSYNPPPSPYQPQYAPPGESASYYGHSPSHSPYPPTPNQPQSPYASSPMPPNDDLRHRLEAAGVSQGQIAQILNAPPSPQPIPSPQYSQHQPGYAPAPPIQAMQNMALSPPPMPPRRPSEQELLSDPNFPEHWPTDRPIVLERRELSDELEYVVPAGCSNDSRLYTMILESRTERVRDDLIIKGHNKRQPSSTRQVAEVAYTQHGIWPKVPWVEWGEWTADAGTQIFTWSSDTGILKEGEWMYWTKNLDRQSTGQMIVFTCKIYQTGDAYITKPDDKVICKVEMKNGARATPTIMTITPGYVRTVKHLDEMVAIATSVTTKYSNDIGMWLHCEKSMEMDDFEKLTDISFVPHEIDGFGCGTFANESSSSKPGRSARWKERGKLFASAAKLGHGVASLGYEIGVATGSIS